MKNDNQEEIKDENIVASAEVKRIFRVLKKRTAQRFPALSSVIKQTRIIDMGDSTPGGVGATDGTDIMLNASVNEGEDGVATLAHEAEHKKRGDCQKSSGKHHKIWNIATDGDINAGLAASGTPVKGGVNIPGAASLGAEKLYEVLLKIYTHLKADEGKPNFAGERFTKSEFSQAIFGNHSLWYKALRYLEQKESKKSKLVASTLRGRLGKPIDKAS